VRPETCRGKRIADTGVDRRE